jgi:hypothetical protein
MNLSNGRKLLSHVSIFSGQFQKGIRATRNKLVEPSLKEGFDELYRVTLNKQGLFVVEEFNR